jgi:hypothetical protein
VAGGAAQLGGYGRAAPGVTQLDHAAALVGEPFVAQRLKRHEHWQDVGALLRQAVGAARALAGLAVGLAAQQPGVDELAQAARGDRLADPD